MSKWILIAVLLAGCAVKKDGAEPGLPQAATGQLPMGVSIAADGAGQIGRAFKQEKIETVARGILVSAKGKFVLAASNVNLVPREDNVITYRLTTNELTPTNNALTIEYDMPSMKMDGLTSTQKTLPDGRVEVTYEGIAHGGEWEVRVKVGPFHVGGPYSECRSRRRLLPRRQREELHLPATPPNLRARAFDFRP
jgi:hypothetical protein